MKSFAGGHGVTVTLIELDGGPVDAHTMDLDATSLRGVFRVQATKAEAAVLMHKVTLTARFTGRKTEIDAFEESTPYSVTPEGPRDIPFQFSGVQLKQAVKAIGLGEHALVIDKRATLELGVFVDVKGSPVDPRITHSVQVVDDDRPPMAAPAASAGAAPGAAAAGAAAAGAAAVGGAAAAASGFTGFGAPASAPASAPAPSFVARINTLFNALKALPGVQVSKAVIHPPCTDAHIAAVHARTGFRLSDEFLNYYRSANGAVLKWRAGQLEGGFALRPLQNIDFGGNIFGADFATAGEYSLPFFGGCDEWEVRSRLMRFDDEPKNQEYYDSAGLYAHATHAVNPVVLFPSDAAACMTDAFPMRATSYLEMVLATAGHSETIRDFPGASGEKKWIIEWTQADWATLGGGAKYLQWLMTRGDVLANYAPAMCQLQDSLRAGETSATIDPKRWIEQRYGVPYPG
ncbi:MAG: SMI1/KNR4 family protein [Polyangiales bacterium]